MQDFVLAVFDGEHSACKRCGIFAVIFQNAEITRRTLVRKRHGQESVFKDEGGTVDCRHAEFASRFHGKAPALQRELISVRCNGLADRIGSGLQRYRCSNTVCIGNHGILRTILSRHYKCRVRKRFARLRILLDQTQAEAFGRIFNRKGNIAFEFFPIGIDAVGCNLDMVRIDAHDVSGRCLAFRNGIFTDRQQDIAR